MTTVGNAATLIPLRDKPGGQAAATSVEQWTAWSFAFDNIADGGNPITDETGAFQNRKQTYPVYHLGGATRDGVRRTFRALAGRPFVIPLINVVCTGGTAWSPSCAGENEATVKGWMDSVDRLFLKVDGKTFLNAKNARAVDSIEKRHRIDTGIFSVDVAPNSWSGDLAGEYTESFNYGFYAFADLPVGRHTVEFGGAIGDLGFSNSVKATVTVAPVPLPAGLPLIAAGVAALGLVSRRRRRATA
jgi:hypothetical protein